MFDQLICAKANVLKIKQKCATQISFHFLGKHVPSNIVYVKFLAADILGSNLMSIKELPVIGNLCINVLYYLLKMG